MLLRDVTDLVLGVGGPAPGVAGVGPPMAVLVGASVVETQGATTAAALGVVVAVPPTTVADEANVGGAVGAPGIGAPPGTANGIEVDFGCTVVPPVFRAVDVPAKGTTAVVTIFRVERKGGGLAPLRGVGALDTLGKAGRCADQLASFLARVPNAGVGDAANFTVATARGFRTSSARRFWGLEARAARTAVFAAR